MSLARSLHSQSCRSCVGRQRWRVRLQLQLLPRTQLMHQQQHRPMPSRSSCVVSAKLLESSVIKEAMAQTRDEKRDRAYREGAMYLRTFGIESQTELTRVLDVAMNPNSLFADHRSKLRGLNASARLLSVDDDIRPVVEYLGSLGLNTKEVRQVIIEHPPVISYSPTERLAPFIDGLTALGIQDPLKIIVRRPSLLGLSVEANLKRIIEYLLANGNSMEQVEEMLATTI